MLTETISNRKFGVATESTVVGPFHVVTSPARELGDTVDLVGTGTPCVVTGRVLSVGGTPLPGVTVDVWQANDQGFYEDAQPAVQPRVDSLGPVHRAREMAGSGSAPAIRYLSRSGRAMVVAGAIGKPGNYFARQIARWSKQYKASETRHIQSMENLIAWLPENIPAGDETTLVHGDFRLDNLIFHPTEPRIIAVLDWELSTLGHPLADFSYHMLAWRLRPDEFRGMAGVDIAALGIPNEQDYVRAYCKRTGRQSIKPRDWDFYLAYNMFRLACIRQGIMRRVIDGNASNPNAADVGRRAGDMADTAWRSG